MKHKEIHRQTRHTRTSVIRVRYYQIWKIRGSTRERLAWISVEKMDSYLQAQE